MALSSFSDPFWTGPDVFGDPFLSSLGGLGGGFPDPTLALGGGLSPWGGFGGPSAGALPAGPRRRRIRIDLAEHDDNYELYADIPGVDKEAIKLQTRDDNTLTIQVDKPEVEPAGDTFLRGERVVDYAPRTVRLPRDADLSKIEAKLEKGVLMLKIPKTKVEGGKTVSIS